MRVTVGKILHALYVAAVYAVLALFIYKKKRRDQL